MKTCQNILEENRGESMIGGSIYIDPLGFEYPKCLVACYKCMFSLSPDSCVFYKEKNNTDSEISAKMRNVSKTNECDEYLIRYFSETDNKDEIARREVKEIAKKLNYP